MTAVPPAPPTRLVVFGAGGDLTWRKLLPALWDLHVAGYLNERVAITGVDVKEFDDAGFREHALDGVRRFSRQRAEASGAAWDAFAGRLGYLRGDFGDAATYRRLGEMGAGDGPENRVFYLATPPALVEPIVDGLADAGLLGDRERSSVVVEKPFGHDLASARDLDALLLRRCDERQIYRIDHYLGKETVQNILAFRFANAVYEPIWNRNYIDHVQITVAESVGVEHRGGYYDRAGALRDMVQNHLMQLLCLVAMEPPVAFGAEEIRGRKSDVLRSVRPIAPDEVPDSAVRGQYGSGWIEGERVPAYRDESDVAPRSSTETFAALRLFVDSWRWRGVPFYLRSGKRLRERVSEVVVRFKPVPQQAFGQAPLSHWESNELRIAIQPCEGITLRMQAKRPGLAMRLADVDMAFTYRDSFAEASPEAYETLLLDAMRRDATLFMRADQVEHAWEIVAPVLERWSDSDEVPRYDAGGWGPDEATEMIARDGRSWVQPRPMRGPGEGAG